MKNVGGSVAKKDQISGGLLLPTLGWLRLLWDPVVPTAHRPEEEPLDARRRYQVVTGRHLGAVPTAGMKLAWDRFGDRTACPTAARRTHGAGITPTTSGFQLRRRRVGAFACVTAL